MKTELTIPQIEEIAATGFGSYGGIGVALCATALSAIRERDKFRVRADEAEGALASATDVLNTWARESYVTEAYNERSIKTVIDGLGFEAAKVRMERDELRQENKVLKEEAAVLVELAQC